LIAAVVDVLDAGQRVLLDRMELAVIEVRAGARSAVASFALVLAGLALLLVGWVASNIVGVLLIEPHLTRAQAIAIAALVNFVVGGIALLLARPRAAKPSDGAEQRGRAKIAAAGGTSA
jgi:hypothetical protein